MRTIIDKMVDRFLGWKLPQHFYPDCHVSFDREKASQFPHSWPVGTNILTAEQARAMFLHCLGGADPKLLDAANDLLAALNAMLTHMGMDEDEWNKPTFDQARAAIAKATGAQL